MGEHLEDTITSIENSEERRFNLIGLSLHANSLLVFTMYYFLYSYNIGKSN